MKSTIPKFIKIIRDKNSKTPILHELQCRFFEDVINIEIKNAIKIEILEHIGYNK